MNDSKITYFPWPNESNYERFATFCAEAMPATFFEFASEMQQLIENEADRGVRVRRVAVEPSSMATWCRSHYRAIHFAARQAYARHVANNGGVVLS
jgi:hypothetical protein